MPLGRLSGRRKDFNDSRHHIYNNNGTYYVAFTVAFDHRTRRVRVSLKTSCIEEAIRRRDDLFAHIDKDGHWVPDRRPQQDRRTEVSTWVNARQQNPTKATGQVNINRPRCDPWRESSTAGDCLP
jgi:hypothetical protein